MKEFEVAFPARQNPNQEEMKQARSVLISNLYLSKC